MTHILTPNLDKKSVLTPLTQCWKITQKSLMLLHCERSELSITSVILSKSAILRNAQECSVKHVTK